MIDKLKQTIQEATDFVKDQANQLGEDAKEKSYKIIDEWLLIFPKLEMQGLEITSFALSAAISPALQVELVGKHEDFPIEKLNSIIEENKRNTALVSVFTTIKTTYNLQRRTFGELKSPLIVQIKVCISPEIKVFLGKPIIQ